MKRVILAEPRGFCAGVRRAIEIVERALEIHGPPVYVRKEIVHNRHVIGELERRGAIFTDSEDDVPEGAICVFSAHGVSPAVRENSERRGLRTLDATCPLVSKVHQEARRFSRDGRTILLIGHNGHEEVEGTAGEAPDRTIVVETPADAHAVADELGADANVGFLTQTTLSIDDTAEVIGTLRERFTQLRGPGTDDICYASQNRQGAVKAMAARSDLVLIVGSPNSSNSVRMVEVAVAAGTPGYLVPSPADLDPAWLEGVEAVGVSAGASTPEVLVDGLVKRLAEHGYTGLEIERTATEDIVFALPGGLK